MITKQGSKPLLVKVDPGADVNTVPLSKYKKLFPTHFTKAGNLKQKILHPTRHTWRAHDETPQQFLGFFIADIHHKTTADVLPVRFYVFKDTTSPKILLSYAASEKLGIVKFQIPNETPTAGRCYHYQEVCNLQNTNPHIQTCEEEHQTSATIEICHKEAHIARP